MNAGLTPKDFSRSTVAHWIEIMAAVKNTKFYAPGFHMSWHRRLAIEALRRCVAGFFMPARRSLEDVTLKERARGEVTLPGEETDCGIAVKDWDWGDPAIGVRGDTMNRLREFSVTVAICGACAPIFSAGTEIGKRRLLLL